VGTVELRLEDWWLSLPLSRPILAVVDGCLLGGTGWQLAALCEREQLGSQVAAVRVSGL
jgi:hypothetical protein